MSPAKGVERKRGNRLGFWFFRTVIRTVGLRGAYGFLYFVSFYYLVFDRAAVRASLAYTRRRFPRHGMVRQLFDVYLLFVSQGKSLIDRFYVIAGGSALGIQIQGYEKLKNILAVSQKGVILLTAHVGNWQVAMTALRNLGKTVYLMMRPEDNAAVRESLNIGSSEDRVRVLYTNDSLGGVIEAVKALDRGDLVSIMGDRTYEYDAMEATLLGGGVRFPYGAFSIAAATQCPVVVLLSAKISAKKYIVDVSHIIEPPSGGRGKKQEAIRACVAEYARVLERYAESYPYQWFVFRDMWKSNE